MTYILKNPEGKEIFRGTEDECFHTLLKVQSFSTERALNIEGWAIHKEVYHMSYDDLSQHVGHKLEINDVTDWHTNREIEIEIRCTECETEPLFTMEAPLERKQ